MGLPAVKDWKCQNPKCGRTFTGRYQPGRKFCPECHKTKNWTALANEVKKAGVVEEAQGESSIEQRIRELLKKEKALNIEELADGLDCGPAKAKAAIASMSTLGHALQLRPDGRYTLEQAIEPGGKSALRTADRGDGWTVIGHTADNHLCSKHERLDVLNWVYDIFEREGVTAVYNGGNWIEGESRINRHDIKVFGLDNQVDYFIQHYPQRSNIKTYYVAGNDHEGWYTHREQINIGRFAENKAISAGRKDLIYIGNVESDVKLEHGKGSCAMKIMHGGGGNAYALSYVLQKTVEAFQGGEKPSILHVGHHHKFCYCYPRNVHAFMPGSTEDQSIFMRTRKIEAHVGAVLTRMKQDKEDGHITEFECRWIPFYDRGFYEKRFE